jgi:RHS repeat-associated protein
MMLSDLLREVCAPDRTPETLSFASVSVYVYRNTAFGEKNATIWSETVSQRYTFQGRESGVAGAPMYYRNRQYSPELGRFGRRDPGQDKLNQYNVYAAMGNDSVNRVDPRGLWWLTWVWNPNSHKAGKYATCEGILPSDEYETSWLGVIIDQIGTQYASQGRSGPIALTAGTTSQTVTAGLSAVALGASYVRDKGAGARLQWSGENEFAVTLNWAAGSTKCAKVTFTAARTDIIIGVITGRGPNGRGAIHGRPRDVCVCCGPKSSFNLGKAIVSIGFFAKTDVDISSTVTFRAVLTPQNTCP